MRPLLRKKTIGFAAALLALLLINGCAPRFKIETLPIAPATARVRVYIQVHSTRYEGKKGNWRLSDAEFEARQYQNAARFLTRTGIYQVVSGEDERAVLGNQKPTSSDMERNEWALARQVGRALYADYVMVMERGINPMTHTQYFENIMINVESGKKFGARYSFAPTYRHDHVLMKEIIRQSYRDLFNSSKDDLLATAIRKSQNPGLMTRQEAVNRPSPAKTTAAAETGGQKTKEPEAPFRPDQPKTGSEQKTAEKNGSSPADTRTPAPAVSAADEAPLESGTGREHPKRGQDQTTARERDSEKSAEAPLAAAVEQDNRTWVKHFDAEKVLTQDAEPVRGKNPRLVVYDSEAPEQYKTVALILTEALREELFRMKRFVLVNREDLEQVLQEMALQQTGLVDEKDAVKTGKGLAASQVVTGRLGVLGKTYLFQTKRIDVESFATLGLSSAKFKQGQEEQILDSMSEIAKRLIAGQ